jgi:hypothetical protein
LFGGHVTVQPGCDLCGVIGVEVGILFESVNGSDVLAQRGFGFRDDAQGNPLYVFAEPLLKKELTPRLARNEIDGLQRRSSEQHALTPGCQT